MKFLGILLLLLILGCAGDPQVADYQPPEDPITAQFNCGDFAIIKISKDTVMIITQYSYLNDAYKVRDNNNKFLWLDKFELKPLNSLEE